MDTTYANSGHKIGAGVILERLLGRALLKPYCRHHILETVQKRNFETCNAKSSAPANPEFKKFRTIFPHLNLDLVEPCRNNPFTDPFLANELLSMEKVCNTTLNIPSVRSDYKQYAEVCLDLNGLPLPGLLLSNEC